MANVFQTPRGSNPLLQTKRGKLQQKRSTVNEQISKQLRMRAGAENLLRATTDKKLRDQIILELSFVDSNLQLLRDDLSELNTAVQIYQNEKCPRSMPLIPLGLKETKDVDFHAAFKDVIVEHYMEDAIKYEHAIKLFCDFRTAIKTPSRTEEGVKLLFEYYNQLCCAERRFFTPGKHLGVYFEWFDSVTGVPAMQRSVAFEKGSVLFNIGALYTQLGASEDRTTTSGLEKAIEHYSRAAGVLYYLKENFSNSPSVDMRRDVLDVLLSLLVAQVQECFFDIRVLEKDAKTVVNEPLKISEEAAQVSKTYAETHRITSLLSIKQYLPAPWLSLLMVKRDHYMAVAHFFTALALVEESAKSGSHTRSPTDSPDSGHHDELAKTVDDESSNERRLLARVHAKCAVGLHEEAINEAERNKQLRRLVVLQDLLKKSADRTQKLCKELDCGVGADSLDFYELYETPDVVACSTFTPTLLPPEFQTFKVIDLFRDLGPLNVFCARNHWTPVRTVRLRRTARAPGFGFSVRGDAPVCISAVEPGGLAALAGVNSGDIIVAVDGRDSKWASHDDLVKQIRSAGDTLGLNIVSPRHTSPSSSVHSLSTLSSVSCSSAASSKSSSFSSSPVVTKISDQGFLTLPSKFQQQKIKQSQSASTTASQCSLVFSTLKNLKQKRSKNADDLETSSWRLRNLLFARKHSKSVDSNMNNPRLFG